MFIITRTSNEFIRTDVLKVLGDRLTAVNYLNNYIEDIKKTADDDNIVHQIDMEGINEYIRDGYIFSTKTLRYRYKIIEYNLEDHKADDDPMWCKKKVDILLDKIRPKKK